MDDGLVTEEKLVANNYCRRPWKGSAFLAVLSALVSFGMLAVDWAVGMFDIYSILSAGFLFLVTLWLTKRAWNLFVNRNVWGAYRFVGGGHSITGYSDSELVWVPYKPKA